MSYCYLGIDQSLSGTGLCILEESGKVIKTGLIKPPKKLSRGVIRLKYIADELTKFILDNCSQYDEIRASREEYSFSSKGSSIFNLGELGGVIDLTMYMIYLKRMRDKKFFYFRIPAGVHKKFVIKNGAAVKGTVKATKLKYLSLIHRHTGQLFDDDNIADSYMIARTLRGYYEVTSNPEFLGELDEDDRENRLSFFPPKLRKRKKLTPSGIYSMEFDRYSSLVSEVFTETYMVFDS